MEQTLNKGCRDEQEEPGGDGAAESHTPPPGVCGGEREGVFPALNSDLPTDVNCSKDTSQA